MHRSTKSGAWCSICDKIEDKLLVTYRVPFVRKERKKRKGRNMASTGVCFATYRQGHAFFFQTCGSLYGWQWHNLLLFSVISYVLSASISLRFVHVRLHSLRQKRSQCLACHSFFVQTQTNTLHGHAPRTPPSLLYPTIHSSTTTSSHNKQNRTNIVHIIAQSRLHVFAKWNALAQASPLFPPFPMNKIYYCV